MKKIVSLFLAAVMLFGMMQTVALADNEKKLTYSVFQQGDDVPDPEAAYTESGVIKYWQDMFNIEVEWQIPPQGSEADQMSMMLGTGDYTDLMDMSFNTENLGTLCDDGDIWDLTPTWMSTCPTTRHGWTPTPTSSPPCLTTAAASIWLP